MVSPRFVASGRPCPGEKLGSPLTFVATRGLGAQAQAKRLQNEVDGFELGTALAAESRIKALTERPVSRAISLTPRHWLPSQWLV